MDRVHQHRHRGDVPAPTPVVEANILPAQILPTPIPHFKREEDDLDVPDEIDASVIADADETDLGTELAVASGEATVSQTLEMAGDQPPTSQLSIPSPSTSSAPSDNAEEGMSAGAKAGIAFGVLGGALLLGLIIFFVVSHRRKAMAKDHSDDGEKSTNGVAPPPPPKSAPRLSLRPVTQFFPNLGFDKNNQGNGKGLPPPNGAPYERPDTSQSNYANPFGKGAERVPSPVNEEPVSPVSAASSPRAAGAGAYVARKTSLRAGPQKNLPKRPVSPVGSEYSMSSIYTANVPTGSSPSAQASSNSAGSPKTNVHRVQLDFKPTLPDEMELRPGDLVQLLHEYDDGWALCIRLDRSKQGVVPRTCLSTRPVKPRPAQGGPAGGPRGPGQRAMTPNGRSESPARPRAGTGASTGPPVSLRNQSPMGRPGNQGARTQSPARQPGRPQSPGGMTRQVASPGPSPMNPFQDPRPSDAPLPGQAL